MARKKQPTSPDDPVETALVASMASELKRFDALLVETMDAFAAATQADERGDPKAAELWRLAERARHDFAQQQALVDSLDKAMEQHRAA
jgi:hypothetical protein